MLNHSLLITGASGLVGKSLSKKIKEQNLYDRIFFVNSKMCDLRNEAYTQLLFYDYEVNTTWDCIHLAARVGGLGANTLSNADFFSDNIRMNTNIIDLCHRYKVNKLLSFASTCAYPDKCQLPLKEKYLHQGEPHISNYGYAYSKRSLDIQSKAYRDQYGCNFIVAIPTNIYGVDDNFDLENSHVIPGIVHKIFLAHKNKNESVELWGDGNQERDFIFADDLSKALILIMSNYNDREAINIATGREISIKKIAELIRKNISYSGVINWNKQNKGVQRKPVDITKITNLGWKNETTVEKGIEIVCKWFLKTYPNIRK
jgi:GDP-L-fucose synthase